jgi:hypothetical protein
MEAVLQEEEEEEEVMSPILSTLRLYDDKSASFLQGESISRANRRICWQRARCFEIWAAVVACSGVKIHRILIRRGKERCAWEGRFYWERRLILGPTDPIGMPDPALGPMDD